MPPFSSTELLNHQSLEIDVCVTPSSKPQQQDLGPAKAGRSVRFASSSEPVICFPKNTPVEQQKAWYSQAQLQSFKLDSAKTVHILMNSLGRAALLVNSNELCERGLETMSKAGSLQKNSRLRYARKIVLDEQEDQKEQGGVIDGVRLAELYKESASKCVASAIARGKFDAEAAQ
jgi:hypothetical protein